VIFLDFPEGFGPQEEAIVRFLLSIGRAFVVLMSPPTPTRQRELEAIAALEKAWARLGFPPTPTRERETQ